MMEQLKSKIYKSEFTTSFPGDHSGNMMPRQTPGMLYSNTTPTPVSDPVLLAWSEELATELNIAAPDETDIHILAGNHLNPSMVPYAACYAGHQFGNWAGQLGDGRAITLGEWEKTDGKSIELQLKGAGPTPYSRRGDGRAVLRSSVREYLMSEAMYHLGIPTTRALSLVRTGDQVMRDLFYDGHPALEPGAIVLRTAPSFLRFGNFEMLAARQDKELLQQLTDWTINRYYPHLHGTREEKILNLFSEILERTATMIVEWVRVGFVHGVMNTDNMSILGLTIDYGPFSFLDDFDPDFTPNTTDLPGRRYAFGAQHTIGYWNLGCLAAAFSPLLESTDELSARLENYKDIYLDKYYTMMAGKLGLDQLKPGDQQLIDQLEQLLGQIKPDMTIFYTLLEKIPAVFEDPNALLEYLKPSLYNLIAPETSKAFWLIIKRYQERLQLNSISDAQRIQQMEAANPKFILRNYLLYEAIADLEKGNNEKFHKLQQAIKTPYENIFPELNIRRPDWAATQPGSSTLSCSS